MDGYLVYRRIGPVFNIGKKIGIFQRCLENFDEKPVLLNRLTKDNCMNCHNFWQNGTDRWLLHMRRELGNSMLLVVDGKVQKIDTKTEFNGPAAYPAWHPSGKLIAFSVSKLLQFFHETGECRDVLDTYSNIILYDIPTNTITTTPAISSSDCMEIWPAWSPDGKSLYFCSAPKIETFADSDKRDDIAYDSIKYDLMRIAYNPVNRTWGKLETVISSTELGLSITEPRVSPNGRFVLFTAAKYSQFPIYIRSADLYLLDLQTGRWKKLNINSDRADSFHSWSSNGRWIVFSSKRDDGLFTRPYFSHVDSLGNATKPFVLPQEDPLFYETFMEVFNVPEFTKDPIHISPQILAKAAFLEDDALTAKLDPNVILKK
jgi:dipeptidyl aminopeptidase/acylaminoacyl peptidase